MNISNFADLLQAAKAQSEPQQLLFVFARAELPNTATAEQQTQFSQKQGAALTPILCVDKSPAMLKNFSELVAESQQTGTSWDIVFAGGLTLKSSPSANDEAIEKALRTMINDILMGKVSHMLVFDQQGELMTLQAC